MKPLLVVLAGPPASGKSRLAVPLARGLGLPLIAKDTIKEALMDALGAGSLERSRELGDASFAVCLALADAQLRAGTGAVLEGAFYRDWMQRELPPLLERSRAALIQCQAPQQMLRQRIQDRAGTRHPGHHDAERPADLAERIRSGAYDVPDLGAPCLRLDSGAAWDTDAILLWIRSRWQ